MLFDDLISAYYYCLHGHCEAHLALLREIISNGRRMLKLAIKSAFCMALHIFLAVAFLWCLVAVMGMFLAAAGGLMVLHAYMVLHAAEVDAASQVLAFAGAFVAESIEVMRMAAVLAFLEAEAILAADIAARIRQSSDILGAAARTVLIDSARLTAFVANSITVERLAAIVAHLFDDALQAAWFLAFIDARSVHAAFIVFAYLAADSLNAAMLAVLASALLCLIKGLSGAAL